TRQVFGFWDAGRTWRVRFSPDQPGRWTFRTSCSDPKNTGLQQQGEFLCSAVVGTNLFHQHGPVRVARDHRHLEHADGTPFFWLADTTWNGARASDPKNWDLYAQVRLSQKFSVVQWAVAPGEDVKRQSALTGFAERIGINPDFFKRLDEKIDRLSQAGLLNAIVPLAELASQKEPGLALADDQAILLTRYVVARWGADPVVWLLAFDGDSNGKKASRWKAIGQAVFGMAPHAPVVLYTGETQWLLDNFRDQSWVDIFGYQTVTDVTDDAWKWTLAGPFVKEWTKEPTRPLIPFVPCENSVAPQSQKRFSANDVRHAAYASLLMTVPAGVSYAGQGVINWDSATGARNDTSPGADLPLWLKAMFMPAAKQMGHLGKLLTSVDFWRLHPEPKLVPTQPGDLSPRRYIVSAATEGKDHALIYVPEDRTVELSLEELPTSPTVSWFNPRTGDNSPAVAVVGGRTCQFPTPDPGDWVLVIRAGK
ncbi:MAG TPA: DUF4038 domain-containing protein, partial [Candidatus Binatia bacterium]|nr:DUF4038 domain-containing protein [Candidatus Binatia bacterium]